MERFAGWLTSSDGRQVGRVWVKQTEIDNGVRVGNTLEEPERVKDLEQEVRDLRLENEILRRAATFQGSP